MLRIIKATYGNKDVTDILSSQKNEYLSIRVSNDLFGDPQPGVLKKLDVIYELDNIIYHKIISEDDFFKAEPIKSPIKIDNPTRSPKKVLCFTTSYKRPKMLRGCMQDILNQTYGDIHHAINFAYDPGLNTKNYDCIFDDILKYNKDKITFGYNINTEQHKNYMNAISLIKNIDDYDIFIKIDDDDIYKSDYVENIVSFFKNNSVDITSSKCKTQLNGSIIFKGLFDNLGGNPEGYDFNLTATFGFNRKSLSLIYNLNNTAGIEDFLWRDTWASNNLVHGVVNNSDNIVWYIHGNNISTAGFLKEQNI